MDIITKSNWLCSKAAYLGAFLSAGILYFSLKRSHRVREKKLAVERPTRLIVISGCDSGLGLTIAFWTAKLGYKVLAGCLDDKGEGAEYLRKEFNGNNVYVHPLDVTREDSINKFKDECENILNSSAGDTKLWAIVPNAGVAVFGEFFWNTQDQRRRQMDVNFWGTVNLVTSFQPLLFQQKSRLLVISSDCAEFPLPFLAMYCASKAALEVWTRSLRLEVAKYGVSVVAYQPGSFPNKSRLMSGLSKHYEEMKNYLSEGDKQFYGEFFHDFYRKKTYLSDEPAPIEPIEGEHWKRSFLNTLENDISFTPIVCYEHLENRIFHFVVKYLPQKLSDKFLVGAVNPGCKWTPLPYNK